jgi:carboxylate-amine ligase
MLTVGVEEEFLLLYPDGAVAPVAGEVIRVAGGTGGRLKPEFMAYQVETSTRVCGRLDELRSELVELRSHAAAAADQVGVRLVAAGMPPYRSGALGTVTTDDRYRGIARRFPEATAAAGGACACQVHVGVPDRDLRVEVLARLRPWLPALLALTANSAVVDGADSGWNSYRYRMLLHWPTFRPPGIWADAKRYDRAVRSLVGRGSADAAAGVYLLARLSAQYPTVEVRVADACLTAEDSVLLAGVVRALVAALIDDARHGRPIVREPVDAELLAAARCGTGNPARLLDKIMPAVTALGDTDEVLAGLARMAQTGTGAERQRALLAGTGTPQAFVSALAEACSPVVVGPRG